MLKLTTVLSLFALLGAPAVHAASLKDCNALASELNKMTPMNVDQVTLWKTTVCVPRDGRTVLTYAYVLDVPKGTVNQDSLERLRPTQLAGWCTNPQQRALFNMFDVEHQYSDKDGNFIGKLFHTNRMCK